MVTVIGLGFVGLTTALGFAEFGHKVYGIECNKERLKTIQSGRLPFMEPGLDEALLRHLGKKFIPTEDLEEAIANSECVFYCVGTPFGEDGEADLSMLYAAVRQTLSAIHDDKFRVLVTKSTVPPSTTKERIVPYLRERGISVGERLGVANNPEFLREGHCWEDFLHADRIVLGVEDERSEAILRGLYKNAGCPVLTVSWNTGEFIKYLSNSSLACLISFANEMSLAADKIGGIDTADAFRIAHMDKRWQNGSIRNYFYPGCGYGGYCLPKDTNALYAAARRAGGEAPILKSVIETNDAMPEAAACRVMEAAKEKDCRIGILGLSFNPGSDDVRDTPAAKIISCLNEKGYHRVIAYDPVAMESFGSAYGLDCRMAESYEALLEEADILVIATAWPMFRDIKSRTDKPVVDLRYMLRKEDQNGI